jgi:hypothetical protein
MAYDDRKTTSFVRMNAKISSVNLKHLDFGGVAVAEGRLIVRNAAGKAILATNADHFVMMNFLDTSHGSVKASQKDNFDDTAPVITQGTGGLSGIIGSGIMIGLPTSGYDPARAPVLNDIVTVGANGMPLCMDPAGPPPAGTLYFGTINEISQGIAWFLFESLARKW